MDPKALRIVFLGTPDFAVASLKSLLDHGLQVVAVVTAPDKPAGRSKGLKASAVKVFAEANELPVLQPTNLKAPEFVETLASYKADLQIVVAFRMMPEVVWNQPPMGTFNLHASLLPQYRGAAPINRAVMNGETETGVTTFQLQHAIDTGSVLLQEKVAIGPDENVGVIHDRLMALGAGLVVKTVAGLAEGSIAPKPQSNTADGIPLKEAPKIFREDCRINWQWKATQVHNHIRGLSPYPAAWTELISPDGVRTACKISSSSLSEETPNAQPGNIATDGKQHLRVATADGWVTLHQLQPAGKRSLPVRDILNGLAINDQWTFD